VERGKLGGVFAQITATRPRLHAKRLDGAFAKADKSKFEWTRDFIETGGTDKPPGLTRGSEWPDGLRWVPALTASTAFGKIGLDEGAERPSRAAADLYRYVGPLVNPEVELVKGRPAQRAATLHASLFQSDKDAGICDGTFLAHDRAGPTGALLVPGLHHQAQDGHGGAQRPARAG